MANPIKSEQVIENLNRIISTVDKLSERFSDFAKEAEKAVNAIDFSKTKDLQKLNSLLDELAKMSDEVTEAQKDRKKATEELTKQEKQLAKLTQDQAENNQELAVSIEQIKLQRREDRKAAQEQAKANLNLTTTYDKQRARLNELTKSLINLRLEGDTTSETFIKQQEEFEQLQISVKEAEEEFGRFQRNVGNYPKDADRASRATEKLSQQLSDLRAGTIAIGGALAGGGILRRGINATQEGFDSLQAITEGAEGALNSALGSVGKTIEGASDKIAKAGVNVEFFTNPLKALSDPKGALNATRQAYEALGDSADDNLSDVVEKSVDAFIKLKALRLESLAFTRDSRDQRVEVAKLVGQFETFSLRADDNTRSLEERKEAGDLAFEFAEKALESQLDLLNEELDLLVRREKVLRETNQTQAANVAQGEITAKQIERQATLTEQQALSVQNLQRNLQIFSDQTQLNLDILIDSFETQRTLNEQLIQSERLSFAERQNILDETIDLSQKSFDAQIQAVLDLQEARDKALNEDRLIVEQEKVFAAERERLGRSLTASEVKNLTFTIEKRQELLKSLQDEQLDRDKLLEFIKADATVQAELRESLGLSEEITTRVIEISRERRIVEQETAQAQIDLNNQRIEGELQLTNVLAKEEALRNISEASSAEERRRINEELDSELLKNEIESLTQRLDAIQKFNQEKVEESRNIQKELLAEQRGEEQDIIKAEQELEKKKLELVTDASNEALRIEIENDEKFIQRKKESFEARKELISSEGEFIAQATQEEIDLRDKLNEKLTESDEKAFEKRQENISKLIEGVEQGVQAVSAITDLLFEKELRKLDDQIASIEQRESELRDALSKGALNAQGSLAQLDQERAQAVSEREKALKNQARVELAITSIQALGSNIQSGAENPLAKTFVDVLALRSFWQTLPLGLEFSNFHGTDDTGKAINPLDSNGGRIGMLHDNEQVWSKKDRAAVGFRTRDEIKDLVHMGEVASSMPEITVERPAAMVSSQNMSIERLERIEKAIKELPSKTPVQKIDYDSQSQMIIETVESKGKVERTHRRPGGLYG